MKRKFKVQHSICQVHYSNCSYFFWRIDELNSSFYLTVNVTHFVSLSLALEAIVNTVHGTVMENTLNQRKTGEN